MQILAGNWKMHKDPQEVRTFFSEVGTQLASKKARVIVAVSPALLSCAVEAAANSGVEIFAQNCHSAHEGAFTGETSAKQLKALGVKGTLVGHSERRTLFGETDATCLARARHALQSGLDVIYCLGETLGEREGGDTQAVLKKQMQPVLTELLPHYPTGGPGPQLIVAYEPVWAIGTGKNANNAQIEEAHEYLKKLMSTAGLKPSPVLYGGSVKTSNFGEIAALPGVFGGLVGGASLEAKSYLDLYRCLAS